MTKTLTRRRCPHCDSHTTWQYFENDLSRWIDFCGPCGWIGRGRTALDASSPDVASITLVSEAGGPNDALVPNPWAGIYRLATQSSPWVTWEPANATCRARNEAAIVRGLRENPTQRYTFELCLGCELVTFARPTERRRARRTKSPETWKAL